MELCCTRPEVFIKNLISVIYAMVKALVISTVIFPIRVGHPSIDWDLYTHYEESQSW